MAQVPNTAAPPGISYQNDEGEAGVLTGRETTATTVHLPIGGVETSWAQRVHSQRSIWIDDELRQRASYIATRGVMTPFLVPHRFEGKVKPEKLARARLGYAVGLNKAYLQEILGHIRSAQAHYTWGRLGGETDQNISKDPKKGIAQRVWWDANGKGVSWTNFFEGKVLEWMLTSPAGIVVVDTNRPPNTEGLSQADAERQGIRSSFKFVPFSWVEDYGWGSRGFRWIKFLEVDDQRNPRDRNGETGYQRRHVLYELQPNGTTTIRRYNDKGEPIGTPIIQRVLDTDGQGMLPLVLVKFGEHPEVPTLGSGLLMGLDDIVIDLYNLIAEVREAFRATVFSFYTLKSSDYDGVKDQLESGTRLVDLGEDPGAELNQVSGDANEVDAGLRLIDMALRNWAMSAKRRAAEVWEDTTARSGVSLKAEFQLDLVPLMVSVTETLDQVETDCMFILAQIEGLSMEEADKLFVWREAEFQMEQEASRIARIVKEFVDAIPGMPATLLKTLIMRWAESLEFLNLDEKVDGGDETEPGTTLREVISDEAEEIADADQKARTQAAQFGILGSAAMGATMGGSNNGGGR